MDSRGPIFARGHANIGHAPTIRRWANGDCSHNSYGLGRINRSDIVYDFDMDGALPDGDVVLDHYRNRNLIHRCDSNPPEPLARRLLPKIASRPAHPCAQASRRSLGILLDCARIRIGSGGSRAVGLDVRIRGFSARLLPLLAFLDPGRLWFLTSS